MDQSQLQGGYLHDDLSLRANDNVAEIMSHHRMNPKVSMGLPMIRQEEKVMDAFV